MKYALALCLSLAAAPASAGVAEVIDDQIRPNLAQFAEATAALESAAEQDCRAEALRPAYQSAFDAWMGVSHLRFGPMEEGGRALAISFWPDKRGMVGATVARLVAEEDPIARTPEEFGEVSVAGRGLFALERLFYDEALSGYGEDSYSCALARAVTYDLARMARELRAEWEDYAPLMLKAGEAGNDTYLSDKEARQALYTALLSGLEFTADQRLGRPLGTFERPRPERAEARRSGRSLRNVILSLEALEDMAEALADEPIPVTEEAFDTVLAEARDLDDPVFAGMEAPTGRLKVEILQQLTQAVRRAVEGEIGLQLGVTAGFNATDGD
ncbi:signal peptidase [Aquicoccus sp. SCR17]|nr:signal peptidase [Carideicomes alvinocaridis]